MSSSCNFSSQTAEKQRCVHELALWIFRVLHISGYFCSSPSGVPENVTTTMPSQAPDRGDGLVKVLLFLIRFVIIVIIIVGIARTTMFAYQTSSRTSPLERTRVLASSHRKLHKLSLRRTRGRKGGRGHVVPRGLARVWTLQGCPRGRGAQLGAQGHRFERRTSRKRFRGLRVG